MRRTIDRRARRRERPPYRPRLPASGQAASLGLVTSAVMEGAGIAPHEAVRPGLGAIVDGSDDPSIVSPGSPAGR
jgi:hypothetical protein